MDWARAIERNSQELEVFIGFQRSVGCGPNFPFGSNISVRKEDVRW